MVPPTHPQAGVGDHVVVHVGEDLRLVVVRARVQRLDAASLLQGLRRILPRAAGRPFAATTVMASANTWEVIQSGAMIIAVHAHWDLSRADVNAAMSAAHQSASNGGTT